MFLDARSCIDLHFTKHSSLLLFSCRSHLFISRKKWSFASLTSKQGGLIGPNRKWVRSVMWYFSVEFLLQVQCMLPWAAMMMFYRLQATVVNSSSSGWGVYWQLELFAMNSQVRVAFCSSTWYWLNHLSLLPSFMAFNTDQNYARNDYKHSRIDTEDKLIL